MKRNKLDKKTRDRLNIYADGTPKCDICKKYPALWKTSKGNVCNKCRRS